MRYPKQPLTIDEQLDKLVARGLTIRDRNKAHQVLSRINYYRLSAYYLPFQKDKKQHIFHPGASFERIARLYEFDKALRNIVLPPVEAAEVLARTRITYYLVMKYKDPFCYLNRNLYSKKFLGEQIAREDLERFLPEGAVLSIWTLLVDKGYLDHKGNIKRRILDARDLEGKEPGVFQEVQNLFQTSTFDIWMKRMDESIKESKEEFVRHYLNTYYDDSPGFPLWITSEIISFGQLSKLYAGLNSDDRTAIAEQYGLSHRVFGQWLHAIIYLRNMCAHHSRLWNRVLEIRPVCPRELPEKEFWSDRMFSMLLALKYLTPASFNWFRVVLRLQWLFLNNRFVNIQAMGIPHGWQGVLSGNFNKR